MRLIYALLACICAAGCTKVNVAEPLKPLAYADKVILYSIDGFAEKDEEGFAGYRILGKREIELARDRNEIIEALQKGLNDRGADWCFNPRHGLRAIKDDSVTDYLICFECNKTEVSNGSQIYISPNAQPALDKCLKSAGIPLAR